MSRVGGNRNLITCFICDQKITNERLNLSASTASHTKVGLPEKISQLIGEEFVVVVTEQDFVCKRCASLLNHMDKLEHELFLVKKALLTYVKQKYNLPIEEPTRFSSKPAANGILKESFDSEDLDVAGKSAIDAATAASNADPFPTLTPTAALSPTLPSTSGTTPFAGRKRPLPKGGKEPPNKQTKPLDSIPKMKIYKCGFCTYQSKDLTNVRVHMKVHVPKGKSVEGIPVLSPKSPNMPPASNLPTIKKRLFRCQVCSSSFEDKMKCLEHISKAHTATARQYINQKDPVKVQESQELHEDQTVMEGKEDIQLVPKDDEQSAADRDENYIVDGLAANVDDSQQQQQQEQEQQPQQPMYLCEVCSIAIATVEEYNEHVIQHNLTAEEGKEDGVAEITSTAMEVDTNIEGEEQSIAENELGMKAGEVVSSLEVPMETEDDSQTASEIALNQDVELSEKFISDSVSNATLSIAGEVDQINDTAAICVDSTADNSSAHDNGADLEGVIPPSTEAPVDDEDNVDDTLGETAGAAAIASLKSSTTSSDNVAKSVAAGKRSSMAKVAVSKAAGLDKSTTKQTSDKTAPKKVISSDGSTVVNVSDDKTTMKPKKKNIPIDIEAMIAALHSDQGTS